jgi:HCOMODA/2-hydroxy-3-carboxy-muconic semialdehyde decarboxylase
MWGRAETLSEARQQLVLANRILVRLGLLDSMGHVSVRNPEDPSTYLLSWAKAPRWVTEDDVLVFDLDGRDQTGSGKPPYLERALHGEVYRARPDVHAVVHSHMPSVLPFGLTGRPVRAVVHSAAMFWDGVPLYREYYDPEHEGVYIISQEQARRMAAALGQHRAILLRGHGCVVVGSTLPELVVSTYSLDQNCRVQWLTESVAPATLLTEAEARAMLRVRLGEIGIRRAWENWVQELREAGWWDG